MRESLTVQLLVDQTAICGKGLCSFVQRKQLSKLVQHLADQLEAFIRLRASRFMLLQVWR